MNGQLQTSPGRNEGNILDTSSQPVSMSLYQRSQDLAGIDIDSNLMSGTFHIDQSLLNSYGHQFPADPLHQWYHQNDGPWIPKGLAPPGGQNGAQPRNNGFVFSGPYRESISPSECDTAPPGPMPSDSGYGSHRPRQSIATASIGYEEPLDNHETRSLVGNFAFGMDPAQWSQSQGQTATMQRSTQPEGKELICGTCQKVLKTNSELKKHQQRHTKPHVCNIPGCTRTDGFSTSNDLDRHKRSCHSDQVATGTFYRCTLGACRDKDKIWPRADNFRAHIRRVHRRTVTDDEMEKLIHRPIVPQDVLLPDLARMQQPSDEYSFRLSPEMPNQFASTYWQHGASNDTVVSAPHSLNLDQQKRSLDSQISGQLNSVPTSLEAVQGSSHQRQNQHSSASSAQRPPHFPAVHGTEDHQQFVTPGDLSHRAVPSLNFRSDTNKTTETLSLKTGLPDSLDTDSECGATSCQVQKREGNAASKSSIAVPTAADISSMVLDLKDSEKIKQLLETLQIKGVLKQLGYKKEDTPPIKEKDTDANAPPSDSLICCPISSCRKLFSRRCELKKHVKRHEKPYGCTYESCNKRFGSKNDWKRHENSQHFLLEVWKCDFKALQNPLEVCGKVCHRRETFKQHLANNHHLSGDAMERKLDGCRVGRNCEANFWCGFCGEVIKIKGKGVDAWTERYNHIDDHLAGRNGLPKKPMDDWKSVDPESTSRAEIPTTGLEHIQDSPALPRTADRGTSAAKTIPKESGHVSNTKRKADGQSIGRSNKKAKSSSDFINTILCCGCGEGNTQSGMNPSCIRCQHRLCHNCT